MDLIIPSSKLQKRVAAKMYYNLFSQMLFSFLPKSILGMTVIRVCAPCV